MAPHRETLVNLRRDECLELAPLQAQLGRQRRLLMATQLTEEKSVLGLENPMGTDGFEFVEYTAPDVELLRSLFTKMGFPEVARHKSKNVTLHKQGDCNFVINADPVSYAEEYARDHGPSACAMAFRVKDAKAAHERAIRLTSTLVAPSPSARSCAAFASLTRNAMAQALGPWALA